MQLSQRGLDLIKEFEGCRLTAYQDAVGIWSIGYGCTSADKSITGVEIRKGLTITQKVAENWLKLTTDKKYGANVMKYDSKYHWNQNQYDALVSFAYNIGSIDQLTQNGTRTIAQISEKILAYDKAGGKVLAGLTRRRKAEKELFDTPVKEATKKAYSGTFPTLPKRGYFQLKDTGTQVKYLQKFLNWYGDYDLVVDGDYGTKTMSAVVSFQESEKLATDGLFGSKSLAKAKSVKK